MVRNSDEVALLRATAVKGSQSPSEIADKVGSARSYALMSFALTVSANRRFPSGTKPSEISDYVAGLKGRYPDASKILKPTVAEAVIRAALGEHDRLEGIDPNDAGVLLFFLAHVLTIEAQLDELEVEQFIDQVIELTDSAT